MRLVTGKHIDTAYRCSNEVVRQQGRAVESLPEVCPVCEIHLKNATDLLMHANEIHDLDGVVKQEQFPSFSAFEVRLSGLLRMFLDELQGFSGGRKKWRKSTVLTGYERAGELSTRCSMVS